LLTQIADHLSEDTAQKFIGITIELQTDLPVVQDDPNRTGTGQIRSSEVLRNAGCLMLSKTYTSRIWFGRILAGGILLVV
jgi:hypothetical protein